MIYKNTRVNTWLWRWHIIAGLICLPFMILLSVTGAIYLFKDNVNEVIYQEQLVSSFSSNSQASLPLKQQFRAASKASQFTITSVTLPGDVSQNTAFTVQGENRSRYKVYVDPYTGQAKGKINQKQTLMYDVSKLHGELLLSTPGTLIVELMASWFLVLILTGLYVWWPQKASGMAGFLTIRFTQGSRTLWRDVHAVSGFWLSVFMLIILAGGMPWTEVFGDQLKWVQEKTDSGYPQSWTSSRGIRSDTSESAPLSLDDIHLIAKNMALDGTLTIDFPKDTKGVYKLSNRAFWLSDQKVIYLDQYSGKVVKALDWREVGLLVQLEQVFMRLHQGEYGRLNWVILLGVALLFTVSTSAGLVSYFKRKPKGKWGIPQVPERFKLDWVLVAMILGLGLLFPLFGASVTAIFLASYLTNVKRAKVA